MKNVTTLLLCLFGILTGVAQTFTENGLEYEVTSTGLKEVAITGGTPATTDLVIPPTVSDGEDTFTVTSVGNGAFKNLALTAVTIPPTIVTIGQNSFNNNQLSSLVLPDGITSIGSNAFENNSIQGNLIIPNSVSNLGQLAFKDNQLESVVISNAITIIEEETFERNQLTSVTLPTALIEIDEEAFRDNQITTLELPETVTIIRDRAFLNNQISSLNIPDGITTIANQAFQGNLITNLSLPEELTTIGNQAFLGNDLTELNLSANITEIGARAFENNELAILFIPAGLVSMGAEAFKDNLLESVIPLGIIPPTIQGGSEDPFDSRANIELVVPQGTQQAYLDAGWTDFENIDEVDRGDITDGFLFYDITSTTPNAVVLIGGVPPTTGVTISVPSTVSNGTEDFTVTSIANNALTNNNLTSVTLPNTVSATGFAAFSDNALTNVVLPEGITTISKQSFQNNQIGRIELPSTTTIVDNNAFRNNQLTEVILPATINTIGSQTFENNPITQVTSLNTTPPSIAGSSFSNRDQITLSVPQGTTQAYIDAGWTGFAGIEEFITDNFIFYKITSTAPNEVQLIGGAPPLELTIPSTVSNGAEAFTVTSITANALSNKNLTSVVLPNTVTATGFAAFSNNDLTSVVLPEGITTISKQSFQNNQIGSIELPSTTTIVDNNAFRNNQLTEITLPATINTIGSQTFENNPITEVTSFNTTPPSIAGSSFSNRDQITLNVPQGTKAAYEAAGWTGFASIDEFLIDEFIFYKVTSTGPNEVTLVSGFPSSELTIPSTVSNGNGAEAFTVTSIANNALSNKNLTSVELPNTITDTGFAAFRDNNLTSVVLPEGISTISKQSFQNNEIGSIELPSTITIVDNNAFRNNQLTKVFLPANVNAIGFRTFENNPINEVTSLNTTPPSIEGSSFSNRNLIILNVPEGTTQAYIDAGWTDFASIEEFEIDIRVAPKVFLQGASLNPIVGEEDLMRDSLRESGLLPTTSPYGDGASVSPTVFDSTGANAIVDWVFVELREGPDNENTTVVTSKAALLQRDGDIVDIDGVSTVTFTEEDGDYFIAIKHRNHIGIVAAVPAPLSGTATAVDFTQDITAAKGENLALTTLVNGTFAMIAGDADGSSQILNTDITEALTLAGGGEGYSTADADMNGFVLNSDIQLLVLANSGTVQQFE